MRNTSIAVFTESIKDALTISRLDGVMRLQHSLSVAKQPAAYRIDPDLKEEFEKRADDYQRTYTSVVEEALQMWLTVYPKPKKKAAKKITPKKP